MNAGRQIIRETRRPKWAMIDDAVGSLTFAATWQAITDGLKHPWLETYLPLRRELHQLRSANSRVAGTSTRIQNETDR